MPGQVTKFMIHEKNQRGRNLRPLAAGLAVTVLAAVLNHFIFLKNTPNLNLDSLDRGAIMRDAGDLPSERQPQGLLAGMLYGFAGLVKTLDGRAAEMMNDIGNPSARAVTTDDRIAVVTIDEASLNRIGFWPWSRRSLAKIMAKLKNSRVVGFDILFHEPDRTSLERYIHPLDVLYGTEIAKSPIEVDPEILDNDLYLGRAISAAKTVMGLYFFNGLDTDEQPDRIIGAYRIRASMPDGAETGLGEVVFREAGDVLTNLRALRTTGRGALGEGFMNLFPDPTDSVRAVPLFIRCTDELEGDARGGVAVFPALPLEMIRIGLEADAYRINLTGTKSRFASLVDETDDGERYVMHSVSLVRGTKGGADGETELLTIPVDELGDMMVNVQPHLGSFRIYPAWEVLAGLHDGEFDGKYVLLDITAAGVGNVRGSQLSTGSVPRVFVHANMISNMLGGGFMRYSFGGDYAWQQAFVILSGLAVSLGLFYGSYLTGFLIFLAVLVCLTAGNYLFLYRHGVVVGITVPMASTLFVLFGQFLASHLVMGRDRRFIRNAFSLSVSPSILGYLETHPDRLSSLSGEQRNMTVLFSAIRGFTAISESMTAPDLARFLNEYLTPMADIVMKNLGTVDKFMGDALMAFWNAPTDDADHAKNAARSALSMQAKLGDLQEGWTARGLPRLAIGCGINTGPMFAGYMGSEQRKNYTVMGDNVNIASRLEGLNKIYSSNIIISQTTREILGSGFFCRVADKVRVSGRQEPLVIYELLGEGIQDEARYEEIAAFERVFALYQRREFKAAEALLQELIFISPQPLYDMYMDRLAVYNALPPPPDWDGVFTVTRK